MFNFFNKKKRAEKALDKLCGGGLNDTAIKNLLLSAMNTGVISPEKAVNSYKNYILQGVVPNLYF